MKKYPEYKDSGVDWLGEIPCSWNATLLKRSLKEIKDGTHGSFKRPEEGKPLLSAKNVQSDKIDISESESVISEEDYNSIIKNGYPKKNDLLLTIVGTIGRAYVYDLDYPLAFQRSVAFLRFKKDNNIRFYYYQVQSSLFLDQLFSLAKTSAQSGVYLSDIKGSIALIPPPSEQNSIVRFLDYKTGQIDRFIANRQKQIELLKEQKVSIINFSITRGINKNTKLKKSETYTLDYYPEHWKLTKLKYLLKKKRAAIRTGPFGTQLKNSDLKEDGEIKIYNQRSVIDKNFINGTEYISLEKYDGLKDFVVNPNDLLITTRGTIGKCAIFPHNMEIGVLHPCLIRMQLDERIISNEYAMICLENALFFQEEIKLLSNSTVIEVIYSYNLKEVFLPIPPVEEQKEILAYIREETSNIDTLISKFQKQIDLMQEYRTSLISQAVTGKIDVRVWQPKSKAYKTEELPLSIAAEK